jgi:hypothetical protein
MEENRDASRPPNPDLSNSRWPASCVGLLSIVLLVPLVIATWALVDSQRGWTEARLEKAIQAELPVDCDREQVENWFDKHGIRHANVKRKSDVHADDDTIRQTSGWIEGREANVGFLESGRITIDFFFDEQGRCVGHRIDPFVYSLSAQGDLRAFRSRRCLACWCRRRLRRGLAPLLGEPEQTALWSGVPWAYRAARGWHGCNAFTAFKDRQRRYTREKGQESMPSQMRPAMCLFPWQTDHKAGLGREALGLRCRHASWRVLHSVT